MPEYLWGSRFKKHVHFRTARQNFRVISTSSGWEALAANPRFISSVLSRLDHAALLGGLIRQAPRV
jgi:hypothetical protein